MIRLIILGAVVGGIAGAIAVKIVELIASITYPAPVVALYLIIFLILLLFGIILYRRRDVHVPTRDILFLVLIIICVKIGLDFIIDLVISTVFFSYGIPDEVWPSLLDRFARNISWFIGGVFVGVNSAVALPFLKRFKLQNNIPLLIVLTLFLGGFAYFGGYQFRYNAGNGFVVSGVPAFGVVFWSMLVGGFIARRLKNLDSSLSN